MKIQTIRLFTKNFTLAAAAGCISMSAFAADLYVSNCTVSSQVCGSDSNSGTTKEAPLKTIQRAANLAKAGTTVHVAPGTYSENITTRANGTSAARVRYVSTTKWGAKIIGSGTEATWTNQADYTDIVGFDISGSGRLGILNNAGYTLVANNHIHDIKVSGGCNGSGGAGVVNGNYSKSDGNIIGNVVHDIGIPGRCNGVQGIYSSHLRGLIMNNIVYRASSYGIHLWHAANNVTVMNNTVFNNGSANMGGGIVIGSGDSGGGVIDNTRVANNIVVYNLRSGISEYCYSGQSCIGPSNTYTNNLVFGNGNGNIQLKVGSARNTITDDPQFVNYKADGTGDYRLKGTSKAINAGSSTAAPSTDIDGTARPQGIGFDIGAYEYVGGVSTTTTTTTSTTRATTTSTKATTTTSTTRASTTTTAPTTTSTTAKATTTTTTTTTTLPKAPIARLSTNSLVFPAQLVGTTSALQIVTITNAGNAAMTIPAAFGMSGDYAFGGAGTCKTGVSYAPGASCTASVVFKPTAAGTRTGALTILTNAAPSPLVVQLSGTGTVPAPIASLSATSLVFAPQTVGTTSAIQLVTITNTGNAPMTTPSAFTMTGDFEFGGTGTCALGVSYAPGASCTASVVFKPTAAGTRTGTLSISTNASSTPMIVQLSGTGVSPVPAPIATLSTTSLVFAPQTVGTTSAVQIVTITNTGNAAMTTPSAFTMTGDFAFGGAGTCKLGVSYAPGASCTASVVFKPTATGTRTGTLSISTNASATPTIVTLSGSGR